MLLASASGGRRDSDGRAARPSGRRGGCANHDVGRDRHANGDGRRPASDDGRRRASGAGLRPSRRASAPTTHPRFQRRLRRLRQASRYACLHSLSCPPGWPREQRADLPLPTPCGSWPVHARHRMGYARARPGSTGFVMRSLLALSALGARVTASPPPRLRGELNELCGWAPPTKKGARDGRPSWVGTCACVQITWISLAASGGVPSSVANWTCAPAPLPSAS